jgi:hypothetical protein
MSEKSTDRERAPSFGSVSSLGSTLEQIFGGDLQFSIRLHNNASAQNSLAGSESPDDGLELNIEVKATTQGNEKSTDIMQAILEAAVGAIQDTEADMVRAIRVLNVSR